VISLAPRRYKGDALSKNPRQQVPVQRECGSCKLHFSYRWVTDVLNQEVSEEIGLVLLLNSPETQLGAILYFT